MNYGQINENSFVLFELAGTTYAIPSSNVQQLEMIEHITPVPNAPPAVEGVVFSRGQVIPAINLRTKFGFSKVGFDLRSRLIVVEIESRKLGLIVDSAREFKNIQAEEISPPPETLSGMSGKYLDGIVTVGKRIILILNLTEILKTIEEIETGVEN
ncbi:MAG TPA: chemotaxis protein CheW [Pyrinomonadaceae bacterium]|nr:chemotaxis protein CheW [Pyrinomonadaceae bacterium]